MNCNTQSYCLTAFQCVVTHLQGPHILLCHWDARKPVGVTVEVMAQP